MNVLVVGTGYVGLTTGVALAYLGHQVTCMDIDETKVAMLREGKSPIFEPGLPELLTLAKENLHFTTSYDEVDFTACDVVFIAVGTPSLPDGGCDLSQVQAAAEAIGERLSDHFTVVVNKSTVPIGSGNWVGSLVRDAHNRRKGRDPDDTYAVASNPEFLAQGVAVFDTLYPERIVIGADDPRAIDRLTNLSRKDGLSAVPVVTCDLASAEMIKYAANAFLAVKISFTNEMAQLTSKVGADILQVTQGIGLDSRIGPRFLRAGIGWGGSCFGKDTSALLATAKEYGLSMPIVQAARDVNLARFRF
jgi:UDPglucose 6-dehydrogenase